MRQSLEREPILRRLLLSKAQQLQQQQMRSLRRAAVGLINAPRRRRSFVTRFLVDLVEAATRIYGRQIRGEIGRLGKQRGMRGVLEDPPPPPPETASGTEIGIATGRGIETTETGAEKWVMIEPVRESGTGLATEIPGRERPAIHEDLEVAAEESGAASLIRARAREAARRTRMHPNSTPLVEGATMMVVVIQQILVTVVRVGEKSEKRDPLAAEAAISEEEREEASLMRSEEEDIERLS